jgi:hypothetical protein
MVAVAYEHSHGAVRVKIRDGRLAIGSFAVWASLPARIPIGRRSGRSSLHHRG